MGKLYGWIIGIHWGLYIGNLGKELYIIWAGRSLLKWILLSTKELGNGQDRGMLCLEKLLLTLLLCIQTLKGKTSLFGFPVQMGYIVPPRHGILSELVNRFYLVWYPKYIPRWAIIQWLAFKGRLATKDRLITWGVISSNQCILCNSGGESHSHLFFECPVSCWIWMNLQAKCGFRRRQRGLDEEIAWAVDHVKGAALESRVFFYITMAA